MLLAFAFVPLVSALLIESKLPFSIRFIASVLWLLCLAPAFAYSVQDKSRRRPLPFLPSVGIAYGLYFVLPLILGGYNRYLSINLDPKTDYDYALQLALAGWLIVLVMYYLAGEFWSRIRIRRSTVPWSQARIVFWGFALLFGVLSSTGLLAILFKFTPPAAVMQFLLSLQWLGIALLTVAVRQKLIGKVMLAFFTAGTAVTVGLTLANGSMAPMIQMAAVIGYALWLSGTRIRARWIVGAVLLMALAMSARGVATEFREATWMSGQKIAASDRAMLMFKLMQQRADATGLGATLIHGADITSRRSANMDLMADVVNRTPSEIPYWDGYTYRSLIGAAVPRILWPDKPTKENGNAFGHRYGYLVWTNLITSINLPFLVEFYLNFGLAGVLIGMAIVGVIYRTLDELINHPDQDILTSLIGVIILVPLLMLESDFSLTFGGLLLNGAALYLIAAFMRNSGRVPGKVSASTMMNPALAAALRRSGRAGT